jgi:hypothetical protein
MKPLGRADDDPVQLVSDLLHDDSNQWDEEKVQRIFFPADAAAILSMPRPRSFQEDFWAWGWDNSGVFSVRSVYRELVRRNTISNDGTGSSTDDSNTWKHLWKLKVMPKIRIFWWRVIKNLPQLQENYIEGILRRWETVPCVDMIMRLFHALRECEHVKVFWVVAQDFFEVNCQN